MYGVLSDWFFKQGTSILKVCLKHEVFRERGDKYDGRVEKNSWMKCAKKIFFLTNAAYSVTVKISARKSLDKSHNQFVLLN